MSEPIFSRVKKCIVMKLKWINFNLTPPRKFILAIFYRIAKKIESSRRKISLPDMSYAISQ